MFVPVIDQVPTAFELIGPNPNYSVVVPLAASEDGFRMVAAEARLMPADWNGTLTHEYKFSVAVLDDEADEPFRIFDRDMAKGYLPDEVRPLVMPCVIAATICLVGMVQPEVIYRVTYATRPPDKALHKHQMITDTIIELGYVVDETGTDDFGRLFCYMTKDGDGNVQG